MFLRVIFNSYFFGGFLLFALVFLGTIVASNCNCRVFLFKFMVSARFEKLKSETCKTVMLLRDEAVYIVVPC